MMKCVKLKIEDNIAVMSIDRPEALNALSRTIVDEIDECVESIKDNEDIRCLVMYSEKNFAAGADIKGMVDCNESEAADFIFSPTYNKIAALPFPTIAAIEGYALGGGMELALTADIRIAAESSKMGFPEITLGIFPGAGGTVRLPKIVGRAVARELIFTGDVISSDRALGIGLVNEVVADEDCFAEAMKLAKRIAKRGPIAARLVKASMDASEAEPNVEKAVAIESSYWTKLFATEDQKEGMTAFIEKRKPQFKNR